MFSNVFVLAVFILFCWILGYGIIDRICKCVEECTRAKAIGQIGKNIGDAAEVAREIRGK